MREGFFWLKDATVTLKGFEITPDKKTTCYMSDVLTTVPFLLKGIWMHYHIVA